MMTTAPTYTEAETHRHFAQACNRQVWTWVAKAGKWIAGEEDREIFTNDLVGGNGYGLR